MANFKSTTIKQIAEKANVSIATVSRALNNSGPVNRATRAKIWAAMDELEYKVHSKAKTSPKTIIVSFPDLCNPFNNDLIRGISTAALQSGYKVVYYVMENYYSEASYGFFLNSYFYDGLLLVHNVPDKNILAQLVQHTAVMMCSEHINDNIVSYVAIDDFAAAQKAMEYLIRIGRKKIALVNSSLSNNYAIHRERAYRATLAAAGLPINEHWILNLPGISFELATSAVSDILKRKDPPDAFFCVSDVYAAATIKAAKMRGLSVPNDLAVVGFDDVDIATMTTPSITTVHQLKFQIGYQACSLLIELIEHTSTKTRQIILDTDLIVRSST